MVLHFYREVNQYANTLTNFGCLLDSNVMFFEAFPYQCSHLLTVKMLGILPLI